MLAQMKRFMSRIEHQNVMQQVFEPLSKQRRAQLACSLAYICAPTVCQFHLIDEVR